MGDWIQVHDKNAEDSQLYLSNSLDAKEEVEPLNQGLEAVVGWMRTNNLKCNNDKMEVLIVISSLVLGSYYL